MNPFRHKALILTACAAIAPVYAQFTPASPFESLSLSNTSALPPGWSSQSECLADCVLNDQPIDVEFLFGPAFSDPVHMTIEACVEFCDAQGSRLAGLKGSECRCANIFNPESCFESDPGECQNPGEVGLGCPGNRRESCGLENGTPSLFNIFFKQNLTQFGCSDPLWPGGAPLTAIGSWRFSYFYNDSGVAHVLSQNAAELPSPPPSNSLTTVACVTICNNAGALTVQS
ncbi:hypothetical protein D9619_013168 [Psilocybe cf. subviscida]|uniref:WSC domain-containing protein n=1 Tax=Psilocybe cf. subviscida TaxID=2480587 RepID=A0A8H5EYS4_9AGAR|nr:hypothetical protein D9619_013168 [Psilocybe cf. subviscida]